MSSARDGQGAAFDPTALIAAVREFVRERIAAHGAATAAQIEAAQAAAQRETVEAARRATEAAAEAEAVGRVARRTVEAASAEAAAARQWAAAFLRERVRALGA